MSAYEIISKTLHVEADETSAAWINRFYFRRFTFIRAFVAIACLISIIASFLTVAKWIPFAILAVGLIGLISLQVLRRTFAKQLVGFRDNECNPALFCNRYLAYLQQGKVTTDSVQELFEYGMGLYWLGRWDDAKALMSTAANDLQKPKSFYLYHHLIARCAWAQRDSETLADSISALETIPPQTIAKTQGVRLAELHAFAQLLEFEQAGAFEDAKQTIASLLEQPLVTKAQRVLLAIHTAYCSTDRAEATKSLEYAAQFGGTTWCAMEAKKLLAKTSD